MKNLIAGQRVSRRKKQSLLSKAIAYRSSANNVNIIAQIRQKPARVKRRRSPASSFEWPRFVFGRTKDTRQAGMEPRRKNGHSSGAGLLKKAVRSSARRGGFTFPLSPFLSCLVAAGVLLLSILAFGIQDLVMPNIAYSAEPGADNEF
jgi:hypothetical protein